MIEITNFLFLLSIGKTLKEGYTKQSDMKLIDLFPVELTPEFKMVLKKTL